MWYRSSFLRIAKHGFVEQNDEENKVSIHLFANPQLLESAAHVSVAGNKENLT